MENYKGVTDTELAWLAGILDGEGSFSVHRNQKTQRDGFNRYFTWAMSITIVNSDPHLLRRCVDLLVAITNRMPYIYLKQPGVGRRPLLTFAIRVQRKQDIVAMIEAVLPYLVGKRDQAKLLVDFINSTKGTGHVRIHDHALAQQTIDEMKAMKRPHVNAEVTLAGLRSREHRTEYGVSANKNPRKSVPPERENVLGPSGKPEEASDKEPVR